VSLLQLGLLHDSPKQILHIETLCPFFEIHGIEYRRLDLEYTQGILEVFLAVSIRRRISR
jgi:hypothetical protein